MTAQADRATLARLFAKLASWTDVHTVPIASTSPSFQKAFDEASEMLGRLTEGMEDPWTGARIFKIVRKSARFIVFLDDELAVKWWWVIRPDLPTISAVQARINELMHESCFLLEEHYRLRKLHSEKAAGFTYEAINIRSVIAEAMSLALNGGTQAECEKLLNEAEQYITIAKDQRCRPKFVGFFLAALALLGIVAFLQHFGWLGAALGGDWVVRDWLEAAVAGCFGALISAVSRTSQLKLEPAAKNAGLAVEAGARALIGAAAGILVNFAFHGGLLIKQALNPDVQDAVRLFLCVAAGLSERILPTLVAKADDIVAKAPSDLSAGSTAGAPSKTGSGAVPVAVSAPAPPPILEDQPVG